MELAAPNPVPIEQRLRERGRPDGPVVMYQRWRELLFLHWRTDPARLAATLPPGLTVDTHDGAAWLGVVPFHMHGVRPRFLPAVPGVSDFTELNLRTYVVDRHGRPGVWFYSLDTTHRFANRVARRFFHLNYRLARMHGETGPDGSIRYTSRRAGNEAEDRFEWKRTAQAAPAEPGSLEFFLVERYRLFAHDPKANRLFSGRVHHAPYSIQPVDLRDYGTALFPLNGFEAPARPPDSALASPGVNVTIHPLERVPPDL